MTDAEAAADAFDALSDPTRVAILRELVSRYHSEDGRPVGFADLRRAVGVDDPGRFNYHLDTLADRFVTKQESGYTPTVAGLKAMQSAEMGVYTGSPEPESGTVGYDCPECGASLTATYENHWLSVVCDEHGVQFKTLVHSSVGREEGLNEVVDYAVREVWRRLDRAADGVCQVCRAPALSLSFREGEEVIVAELACSECYLEEDNAAALFALTHPAALSVLRDRGLDVPREIPFEPLEEWVDGGRIVDDGSAVELTVGDEGDGVTLRVHEDLTVETV
jgi:DNA-binding transcriptional ArsR family regulator